MFAENSSFPLIINLRTRALVLARQAIVECAQGKVEAAQLEVRYNISLA